MADEGTIKRNGRRGEHGVAGRHPVSTSDPAPIEIEDSETDAPLDELAQIPRLGPVRRQALAGAGINTLDDLRKLSVEDLAAIKYVGAGNARLIKAWLEAHDVILGTAMDSDPASPIVVVSVSDTAVIGSDTPPPPPSCLLLEPDGPDGLHHGPELVAPATAIPNQIAYDDLGQIDLAIAQIKRTIPKKSRHPRLTKQLAKVSASIGDVPENLDMLTDSGHADAATVLEDIAKLLDGAVQGGKLTVKKQEKMGTKLKKLRRRLDEIVGG